MSLAVLTGHLEDLASSESGLRRSRAMAQLWSEIRRSDVEDRRAFALALADRFAPSLSAKFAEATGLDGPEFIRLVRSLIEMDGDDISDVVSDLERIADRPELLADEITVAELIETADRLTTERGRDELMDDVFEELVDTLVDDRLEEAAEPPVALHDDPPAQMGAAPISELRELPGGDVGQVDAAASVTPVDRITPFDLAIERMAQIEEQNEAVEPLPTGPKRDPSVSAGLVPQPESASASPRIAQPVAEVAKRVALVGATPDGWRRRRLISSLIREGRIGVQEALALSDQLTRPSDVRWIIGDLIEADLSLSDRALLASRELPPNLRHRLELAH